MTDFKQSNEFAARRATRVCIRKAKGLTRTEREILVHMTSLWYHHRNGQGVIYPGREGVAKKCRCSIRTVASALEKFRQMGFIVPVKYAKGGSKSTRYTVDIVTILMTLDHYLLTLVDGKYGLIKEQTVYSLEPDDIAAFSGKNCTVHEFSEPCNFRTRILHTSHVEKRTLSKVRNGNIIPFPTSRIVRVGSV